MIGRFPGETSCLTMAWAVMDLVIARARYLGSLMRVVGPVESGPNAVSATEAAAGEAPAGEAHAGHGRQSEEGDRPGPVALDQVRAERGTRGPCATR